VTPTITPPGGFVRGYYTLVPCRLVDTRDSNGAFGGPALSAGQSRTFVLVGNCGIPAEATAVALNLTVTQPTNLGHLTVFPDGAPAPGTSTLNYRSGQTRANNAIVRLGPGGGITVSCGQLSGTTHVIIDVNGFLVSQ